jgi:hypothetical protein
MKKRKLLKYITSAILALVMVTIVVGSASAFIIIIFGPFSDVPSNHWAVDYIWWLKNNGISVGYPDGTFRPNNSITRAEMAVMLKKTAATVVAAGAHIVPKSGGGFEILEWFNNVNGTKPTHTWFFAHGIDFTFDMTDNLVMCAVDSTSSVTSFCSVQKGSTNVLVSVYDTDSTTPLLEPVGFWILVYGKDMTP